MIDHNNPDSLWWWSKRFYHPNWRIIIGIWSTAVNSVPKQIGNAIVNFFWKRKNQNNRLKHKRTTAQIRWKIQHCWFDRCLDFESIGLNVNKIAFETSIIMAHKTGNGWNNIYFKIMRKTIRRPREIKRQVFRECAWYPPQNFRRKIKGVMKRTLSIGICIKNPIEMERNKGTTEIKKQNTAYS